MAQQYANNYAQIELDTGWCLGVVSLDMPSDRADMIPIPVYDEEYIFKFYNRANGQWYEDAAFTIPWQSALI